jgi:hypothetical protein
LQVGDLQVELISAPGGETTDSMIVWLPQHRTALVSNLLGPLFPHFPNFHTLRGSPCAPRPSCIPTGESTRSRR